MHKTSPALEPKQLPTDTLCPHLLITTVQPPLFFFPLYPSVARVLLDELDALGNVALEVGQAHVQELLLVVRDLAKWLDRNNTLSLYLLSDCTIRTTTWSYAPQVL